MILGFGVMMFCCLTWQFMKNFLDSISYRVGGLFGVLGYLDSVMCQEGVWYIYDWGYWVVDTDQWEAPIGFARMLFSRRY